MSRGDLFEPGERLGDYEIISRLRAGGMATLFLGRRHGTAGVSRLVVIKVIHPQLAEDEQIVNMFIDEARISSQISHPNVVYIENFGEYDGVFFMAMEYVEGCSLEQLMRAVFKAGEKIPPEVAVHIILETASGLHAAHEAKGTDGEALGVVHRDVSPSNILLTEGGRIKVIDFGIAKARNRVNETTRAGSVLKGKLRYMSPEQACGLDTDRRTDVYALGVVLWEVLALRNLFRASSDLALLELVRNPQIPSVREFNPLVPEAVDEVIKRATAKSVDDRIATALDLRRELAKALPAAMMLEPEAVQPFVQRLKTTVAPYTVGSDPDRKSTTPARWSAPSMRAATEPPTSTGGTAPSVPAGGDATEHLVLEVSTTPSAAVPQPPARSNRRRSAIVAGLVSAGLVVAGAAVVLRRSPSAAPQHPVEPAAAASVVRLETVAGQAAPAASSDAGVGAPALDTGPKSEPATTATEPTATAEAPATSAKTTTKQRKQPAAKTVVKTASGPSGVEVNGTLLADDPSTTPTKPKTPAKAKSKTTKAAKSPASHDVDGAILAE